MQTEVQVEGIMCPNCKEEVPKTLYCLNCGYPLYKISVDADEAEEVSETVYVEDSVPVVEEPSEIDEGVTIVVDDVDVPVVEDDMSLIGVFSEKDVISLLYYAHGDDEEKTVDDFMTQPPIYFDEDETLLTICDCLVVHSFRRILITSEGKLAGIISRADIIDCILHLRKENTVVLAEKPSQ